MEAYYNEFDPRKAHALRALQGEGILTPGAVDERSIKLVSGRDIIGYRRVHFFAGIGVWDAALRVGGWPETEAVWTASCPCQPFSTAGQRKKKADERHLLPELVRLVAECGPNVVMGEQVSGTDGVAWIDDVFDSLGRLGYSVGALSTTAAGAGAYHNRERLYWAAIRLEYAYRVGWFKGGEGYGRTNHGCLSSGMADSDGERWSRGLQNNAPRVVEQNAFGGNTVSGMADAKRNRWQDTGGRGPAIGGQMADEQLTGSSSPSLIPPEGLIADWGNPMWVLCRPKRPNLPPTIRPVEPEPESFPLAHGVKYRVGTLHCYGDAIVLAQAAAAVESLAKALGIWRGGSN